MSIPIVSSIPSTRVLGRTLRRYCIRNGWHTGAAYAYMSKNSQSEYHATAIRSEIFLFLPNTGQNARNRFVVLSMSSPPSVHPLSNKPPTLPFLSPLLSSAFLSPLHPLRPLHRSPFPDDSWRWQHFAFPSLAVVRPTPRRRLRRQNTSERRTDGRRGEKRGERTFLGG